MNRLKLRNILTDPVVVFSWASTVSIDSWATAFFFADFDEDSSIVCRLADKPAKVRKKIDQFYTNLLK